MCDLDLGGCDFGGCDCSGCDCGGADCQGCDCCKLECDCGCCECKTEECLGCNDCLCPCCGVCVCDDHYCGKWIERWDGTCCEGMCSGCGLCVRDCCFDCRNIWCKAPDCEIEDYGECGCSPKHCNLRECECCREPCGYWILCHCCECDPWCTWPSTEYNGCDCKCCTHCSNRRTCRCCSKNNRCESEISVQPKPGNVVTQQPTAHTDTEAITTQPT
ncbi:keratin-associated protein 5-9-like [Saccostrea cucullata]|uniref:keratin-associated protein 5-9-like n=1 Tax=Saccostrea cuccullata TaxID=36930 RepID=UPI002ED1137E